MSHLTVSEDVSEDVSQDASQEVSQDVSHDVSQDVSQDVRQDVSQDLSREAWHRLESMVGKLEGLNSSLLVEHASFTRRVCDKTLVSMGGLFGGKNCEGFLDCRGFKPIRLIVIHDCS